MKISENRKLKILQRLLIYLSVKDELQDILKLVTAVCNLPAGLINLVNVENQDLIIKSSKHIISIPLKDSFCIHTLKANDLMEVKNAQEDPRFCNNPFVAGKSKLRFYAGVPLRTDDGEDLGCLVVTDKKPNALSNDQKDMLKVLAKQIKNILEFQFSLELLKGEIKKVHDSEVKLKCIFENSSDIHIFLDKNLNVLAFNQRAANMCRQLNKKELEEKQCVLHFISEEMQLFLKENLATVLCGNCVKLEKEICYHTDEYKWWSIQLKPVYDYQDVLIGATLDVADITESNTYKQRLINQNIRLKKIAQVQSHEIRRTLANIVGIAKLLQNPYDADFSENLDHLLTEAYELDNKIRNIVSLATTNI